MPHAALLRLTSGFDMTSAESVAYAEALGTPRTFAAGEEIAREGESADRCAVLLEGFAKRTRVQADGNAQILSFVLPGDMCDLQTLLLNPFDHTVSALMPTRIAYLPHAVFRRLIVQHPGLALSFWRESLIDAAIFREWMVNIATRDAYTRLSHLLCEIYVRMDAAGLIDKLGYGLPLSQQLLADATGLTVVHVNRTLKRLKNEGLVTVRPRAVAIHDWNGLSAAGGFNPAYLHSKAVRKVPAAAPAADQGLMH